MGDYQRKRINNKISALLRNRTPYWIIWNALIVLVLLVGTASKQAYGQSVEATLRCPKKPLNLSLYTNVIARQVELGVDSETYSNVRAVVRLRQTGRPKTRTTVTATDVLSGLTFAQEGLIATLSGGLSYSTTCDYPFVVRVKVRATDIATKTRLASSTESLITLTSPGEFVVKRVRTVDETPSEEEE